MSHLQNKQVGKQTNKQKTHDGGSGSIHELERFNSRESHGTCSLRLNNERKKKKLPNLMIRELVKVIKYEKVILKIFSLQKNIKILYIQTNILNMLKK